MEKKSRREILLKELQELEDAKPEEAEDLGVQRDKDVVEKVEAVEKVETITRAKKPRTEAQLKVFERARETAKANAEKRKAERDAKAEEERKVVEEKLVKKAISVKKKQIKQQAILDEISDDETDMVEIEKIVKRLPSKSKGKPVELPAEKIKPSPYIFF